MLILKSSATQGNMIRRENIDTRNRHRLIIIVKWH